ncbi:MAG: hypothetical protein GF411_08155 [Candidatus Lokiarchaeota archaeon]|nr:hypothetical protein [Candidatus Lokiarchaeota archaeon]
MQSQQSEPENAAMEAVFLYKGILDAYEAVGTELIGPDVLEDHVLPRMVYYVKEFLPEAFSEETDSDTLSSELKKFMENFKKKVDQAFDKGSVQDLTMEDIWKLRAAIFGYESVFIEILGEAAIKNYVFMRMSDILSAYLPERMLNPTAPLKEKLEAYVDFIKEHDFVGYARVKYDKNKVTIAANRCAFARIHDSEAYRNLDVRFCPWGMIASAIVTAHQGREALLSSSLFTTTGSVSDIAIKEEK